MADELGELIENRGRSWYARGMPPQLPPLPDQRGSIQSMPQTPRPKAETQEKIAEGIAPWGAGPLVWEAGKGALEAYKESARGAWAAYLDKHGVDLAGLFLAPVPGIRPARAPGKHAPTRGPSLEAYVDFLRKSDPAYASGTKPLFRWEGYLDADPTFTIGGRPHDFEIPHQQHNKLSKEARMLEHPGTKKRVAEAAEPSLYEGPHGNRVNPWYWPHVLFEAVAERIGPDAAHDWLTQYLGYNATTSMETRPRRAALESWLIDYHNRHDIPINKLQPWELTGRAYNNKVDLSGNVAKIGTDDPKAGISGPKAQKIRPYWLNLLGVGGNEPSYTPVGNKLERAQTPVTLDSIMAKPELFRLRDKLAQLKTRFLGPNYTIAQKTIHDVGEKAGGVAGSDMQAAPWQTVQFNTHGDPGYALTHTAILNKLIHDIAAKTGEEPAKVFDDLVLSRKKPPTDIYSVAAPLAAGTTLPGLLMEEPPADR